MLKGNFIQVLSSNKKKVLKREVERVDKGVSIDALLEKLYSDSRNNFVKATLTLLLKFFF